MAVAREKKERDGFRREAIKDEYKMYTSKIVEINSVATFRVVHLQSLKSILFLSFYYYPDQIGPFTSVANGAAMPTW